MKMGKGDLHSKMARVVLPLCADAHKGAVKITSCVTAVQSLNALPLEGWLENVNGTCFLLNDL